MSNYYKQRNMMYMDLDKHLKAAGKEGMVEDDLIYNLTTNFEVSEKAILNRLKLMERRGVIKSELGVYVWQNQR